MEEVPILPMENKFYEKELRLGFIRKVFGIVVVQLFTTFIFSVIVYSSEEFQEFMRENTWILYLCIAIYIVVGCMLSCCKKFARRVPTNYILLLILTLCVSLLTALACSQYEAYSVLMVVILTLSVTVVLGIYAYFTKTDFTGCTGIFYGIGACTLIIIIMVICCENGNSILYFYYWLCVSFYCIYIICDIQIIVNKNHHGLCHEDYIIGAMMLYLDIIGLFMNLLMLFGKK